MQFRACGSASAGDIPSIRGDLRVNQDKLGHEANKKPKIQQVGNLSNYPKADIPYSFYL
jgi:hypothetical protein